MSCGSRIATVVPADEYPRVFAERYLLLASLGEATHRARIRSSFAAGHVCIHEVTPAAAAAPALRQLGHFQHPNVCDLFEASWGDPAFVVTAYHAGVAFAELAVFDVGLVIGLAMQTCAAVHAAHEFGHVYGTLTNRHLLVTTDGIVKISPFARGRADARRFAAPESREPGALDRRTDIYSLGAILGELLGLAANPILRAMAPARDARFATAKELAAALAELAPPWSPAQIAAAIVAS